jgi:hypothetical protein
MPADASAYVWRALEAKGVMVETGQHVVSVSTSVVDKSEQVAVTNKDRKWVASAVFNCTGSKPNTAFLRKHFSDVLDEQGRVKVTPTLQVEGHTNVFAAGDVTAIVEEKLSSAALAHAQVLAKNIIALASGTPAKMRSYTPPKAAFMIVGLGSQDAIAIEGDSCFGFGHKIAAMKKKSDAAAIKFLPKPPPLDLESVAYSSLTTSSSTPPLSSPQMGPAAPPATPRLSTPGGSGSGSSSGSGGAQSSGGTPSAIDPSLQPILVARFVASPLGKQIARAALAR